MHQGFFYIAAEGAEGSLVLGVMTWEYQDVGTDQEMREVFLNNDKVEKYLLSCTFSAFQHIRDWTGEVLFYIFLNLVQSNFFKYLKIRQRCLTIHRLFCAGNLFFSIVLASSGDSAIKCIRWVFSPFDITDSLSCSPFIGVWIWIKQWMPGRTVY